MTEEEMQAEVSIREIRLQMMTDRCKELQDKLREARSGHYGHISDDGTFVIRVRLEQA